MWLFLCIYLAVAIQILFDVSDRELSTNLIFKLFFEFPLSVKVNIINPMQVITEVLAKYLLSILTNVFYYVKTPMYKMLVLMYNVVTYVSFMH